MGYIKKEIYPASYCLSILIMALKKGTYDLLLWMMFGLITIELSSAYVRPYLCRDSLYAIPGHTMCLANTKDDPITASDRRMIENIHNDLRASVAPPAANMLALVYMSVLGIEAQIWAGQCLLVHDKAYHRRFPGEFLVDQNILVSHTNLSWSQVINQWSNEKSNFVYGQANDINLVGNYIQIISSDTLAVGCGMTRCHGAFFYVCNYLTSTNLAERFNQPYKQSSTGHGADDCPQRVSNVSSTLCDCYGVFCLNGGHVNLTSCACDCPSDPSYMRYERMYCGLTCKPSMDQVSCQNKTKAQCVTEADTFLTCPWLCNVCPYAGENYTEGSEIMPWSTLVPAISTKPTITTKTKQETAILSIDSGGKVQTMKTNPSDLSSQSIGSTKIYYKPTSTETFIERTEATSHDMQSVAVSSTSPTELTDSLPISSVTSIAPSETEQSTHEMYSSQMEFTPFSTSKQSSQVFPSSQMEFIPPSTSKQSSQVFPSSQMEFIPPSTSKESSQVFPFSQMEFIPSSMSKQSAQVFPSSQMELTSHSTSKRPTNILYSSHLEFTPLSSTKQPADVHALSSKPTESVIPTIQQTNVFQTSLIELSRATIETLKPTAAPSSLSSYITEMTEGIENSAFRSTVTPYDMKARQATTQKLSVNGLTNRMSDKNSGTHLQTVLKETVLGLLCIYWTIKQ